MANSTSEAETVYYVMFDSGSFAGGFTKLEDAKSCTRARCHKGKKKAIVTADWMLNWKEKIT